MSLSQIPDLGEMGYFALALVNLSPSNLTVRVKPASFREVTIEASPNSLVSTL